MIAAIVLCLTTLRFHSVLAQGDCTDVRGRIISHGLHYVPGPDTCTLCICDNGLPKVCKAVLCSPPQDCHSFRVGTTCCEFICLEDVVKPAEGAEANVRVAAGGAAAAVLLTVALVVYRVQRQKRRRPTHADDQRSLTSIGYISGSMGYMGGTCETALGAWKPPGNYMPRGEAPPPYDEVVAQCREPYRMSSETYHRTFPAGVESMQRPDDGLQCTGHGYVNIPRPVTQMANTQNCYNAPLLQPVMQAEPREQTLIAHHPLAPSVPGVAGFPHAIRLTGSLGAISGRALSVPRDERERPHNVPGFYTSVPPAAALHRTIPRISTAADAAALEGAFLHADVRRSFHRADGRSVPRNLNIAATTATAAATAAERAADESMIRLNSARSRAQSEEQMTSNANNVTNATNSVSSGAANGSANIAKPRPSEPPPPAPAPPPSASLPLTVDKPSCGCSYEGASAPGDDYRSECENCKAASGSRWAQEEGLQFVSAGGAQTQTLQRRAPPPAPPPPATATLPQPVTRHPRGATMGPPSNWENWFNSIPDSDTESEEE
ncbi:uncharacterized protein [Epargyreus clarus]|uniref:uncharacterized protein n=1 Tax=Epargyreus clarus TaxID=520877 RepID=UPI003C2AFCF1